MFDTGAQQSMIGRDGLEIIKCHDTWIDAKVVVLVGPPKAGRRLQLVDARGVVKKFQDGKSYVVIVRQAFFNPNQKRPCWWRTKLSVMVLRYFHVQGSLVVIN